MQKGDSLHRSAVMKILHLRAARNPWSRVNRVGWLKYQEYVQQPSCLFLMTTVDRMDVLVPSGITYIQYTHVCQLLTSLDHQLRHITPLRDWGTKLQLYCRDGTRQRKVKRKLHPIFKSSHECDVKQPVVFRCLTVQVIKSLSCYLAMTSFGCNLEVRCLLFTRVDRSICCRWLIRRIGL